MLSRGRDIVFALIGLGVFSLFYAIASLAILLDDGRPVFFFQSRVGRNRTAFRIAKFRTMRDGEVTRVGRWLRRSGLDETPQFIHVLSGKMSMVGPRPLTSEDVDRLGWTTSAHDFRFAVKPGVTGLAQLLGGRSAAHSLRLDALYIARALRSTPLWPDLTIIIFSFVANVGGKRRARRWMRRMRRGTRALRTNAARSP